MSLDDWIETQAHIASDNMLAAISATHLFKTREGFGQTVRPASGSVLASPVPAGYDPDPDYFFHWFRDSAVVMDALRVAYEQGWADGDALIRLAEFTGFSLALYQLNGARFLSQADVRARTLPFFQKYLRTDAAIAAVNRETVSGETRVNADGTIDFIDWPRPQFDGPALRLIAMLRFWDHVQDADLREEMRGLVGRDIAFTLAHVQAPSYDIWEEEKGEHAYTRLVQAQALHMAARWTPDGALATICKREAAQLDARLDGFWSAANGYIRSRHAISGGDPFKLLDIAVILGVIHAGRVQGGFSPLDPHVQATVAALEQLFQRDYPINRDCSVALGPAMGRYADDRYYSGGAYFFATLGTAEFYYRLAGSLWQGARLEEHSDNELFRQNIGQTFIDDPAAACFQRGDAIMARVRSVIPADGDMAEQFDRVTGRPASAKKLTWSYAAFVTAAAARRHALRTSQARAAK